MPLRAQGVRQGDRLCVQLANCVELIDLYLACVRLGVIFVPVNVLYREREVAHIRTDPAPGLFVTRHNLDELASEAIRSNCATRLRMALCPALKPGPSSNR
jgi:acyl-CoA synthetase (AMP-forming)/AMP-acid ligase II